MTATQERPTVTSADPVAGWLDANTITGEGLVIEKAALLEAYNQAAAAPLSDRAFGQALARLRPQVKAGRRRDFGGKALASVYLGIALCPPGGRPTPEAQPAGGRDQSVSQETPRPDQEAVRAIPLPLINANPWQPRRHFDADRLQELADSIRASGLIQPVIVRPSGDRYELLAGERRWRACARAGLETIPAIVRDVDDRAAAEIALIENLQRDDLTPIEAGRGYQGLRDLGYTQTEIGERVGLSRESVANALRLLKLPEDVQERIERGELSAHHGRAILRFEGFPALMSAIAERAVKSNTPSQDLERGGVPYGWELERAGLLKSVDDYHAPFDIAVCKQCPFNAYRSAGPGSYSGYCLKPEHWQELADAAIAERKAQAAALAAQARESGSAALQTKIEQALKTAKAEDGEEASDQVLDLAKLSYGTYERLNASGDNRPEGCSDQCPCFVVAMERGRLVKACLDPGRLRRLKERQTRAAKKDLKSHFDDLLAQVRQDPPSERETVERRRRALAQIVWQVVMTARVAIRRAAVVGYADADLVRVLSEEHTYSAAANEAPEAWPILARQRPEDLVDLAAEILIREEHRDRLEYKHRETPRTDWYLHGSALPPAAEQPALAEGKPIVSVTPAEAATNPAVHELGNLAASYAREVEEEHGEELAGTWVACNDRRQPIVGSIVLWFEATDGVGPQSGHPPQRARRGRVTEFEGEGAERKLHITGDGWSTVIPASVAGLRIMPMVERE